MMLRSDPLPPKPQHRGTHSPWSCLAKDLGFEWVSYATWRQPVTALVHVDCTLVTLQGLRGQSPCPFIGADKLWVCCMSHMDSALCSSHVAETSEFWILLRYASLSIFLCK